NHYHMKTYYRLLAIACGLSSGCELREIEKHKQNPFKEDLIDYISTIPIPAEPSSMVIDPVFLSESSEEITYPNGQNYACTTTEYKFGQSFSEIAGFNPTEDVVWPGSIVQGKSIFSGIPSRINLSQAPMKITISPSSSGDNSLTVNEP